MDAETVANFLALLILGGLAGTGLAVTSSTTRTQLASVALPLTALVATGAMVGSLYFSKSAGFVPCELCWYQRIAMYPLGPMLALAAFRRDRGIEPYALLIAVAGLGISLYHVQLQQWPDQGSFCEVANPCSGRWVEGLGWMTIPQMAAGSFALIVSLLALDMFTSREAS